MTQDALFIVKEAIAAVNPLTAVKSHMMMAERGSLRVGFKEYNEKHYDNVVLVAFGKASSAMAKAAVQRIEECMPNLLPIQGVVICKDDHATQGMFVRPCLIVPPYCEYTTVMLTFFIA